MRSATRILVVASACYASWLGMMAVHELGHVIGALATGGRVKSISVPLTGFSQTIVDPNPRELLVVWAGPIIGALLPLATVVITRGVCRKVPNWCLFFAGFCAIAKGGYIGAGWIYHAGDAGDMLRLGTPIWMLVTFGVVCVAIGIACWRPIKLNIFNAAEASASPASAMSQSPR